MKQLLHAVQVYTFFLFLLPFSFDLYFLGGNPGSKNKQAKKKKLLHMLRKSTLTYSTFIRPGFCSYGAPKEIVMKNI